MRGPAETALRKAIQLEPNYPAAHNNLAVIYASQQPPLVELARWHYQKALAAGHAKNPDLEKMLSPKESGSGNR
jgi:Tfp pilus assembly protein PilF